MLVAEEIPEGSYPKRSVQADTGECKNRAILLAARIITVESDWSERSIQAGARAEQAARTLFLEILRRAKVLRRTR